MIENKIYNRINKQLLTEISKHKGLNIILTKTPSGDEILNHIFDIFDDPQENDERIMNTKDSNDENLNYKLWRKNEDVILPILTQMYENIAKSKKHRFILEHISSEKLNLEMVGA